MHCTLRPRTRCVHAYCGLVLIHDMVCQNATVHSHSCAWHWIIELMDSSCCRDAVEGVAAAYGTLVW